ncbi:MAG: fumarylacetoacetase [Saprospiraceae bacterium]|nr:fumarylacetoacetase [Saprospiraceae bacterium]
MKSWVPHSTDSDFSIHHLPFGIFKTATRNVRVGVAIGEHILDMKLLAREGFLKDWDYPQNVFSQPFLNGLMALGRTASAALRRELQSLLSSENPALRDSALRDELLVPMKSAELLLPVNVRDYTDFYSSIEHATNVGTMFRGPENALMPNWKHLPVGYHGRASSIIVSGTDIHRPKGQKTPAEGASQPGFGPTNLLDIELEMAFITCKPNALGASISTEAAEDHIWGMVLFNDWSARDIQKWEYVPLGPFLGKSFASSISAWVTPMEALEPFRCAGPEQDPEVLPYLTYSGQKNYDIDLEVWLETPSGVKQKIAHSNFKYMYWNMVQQLAHHTVNGCNINVGDMYGSGTISGPTPDSYGSLLELTWRGSKPIQLTDGTERKFLQDGDTIVLKGYCKTPAVRLGFGEVRTTILPAI